MANTSPIIIFFVYFYISYEQTEHFSVYEIYHKAVF